jgi:hypothetical protein
VREVKLRPQGLCACAVCDKYNECPILEYQYCERFNCIVKYDTSERPVALDLIELFAMLLELIRSTHELVRACRITLQESLERLEKARSKRYEEERP